jgi:hypothetical protein
MLTLIRRRPLGVISPGILLAACLMIITANVFRPTLPSKASGEWRTEGGANPIKVTLAVREKSVCGEIELPCGVNGFAACLPIKRGEVTKDGAGVVLQVECPPQLWKIWTARHMTGPITCWAYLRIISPGVADFFWLPSPPEGVPVKCGGPGPQQRPDARLIKEGKKR